MLSADAELPTRRFASLEQISSRTNPPSPYLSIELVEKIHAVHSTSIQSESKKITKKVLQKFSLSTLFHPHHHHGSPPPMSDGDDHGYGRNAGEEIEASKIEDFVRNIKLYSKRDKMDSLRYLWLGEGTKPENLWKEREERDGRWLEDGGGSAEKGRGRMSRMAEKLMGRGT